MSDETFIAALHAMQKPAAAKEAPMAELVGAFAASHAPLIARDWRRTPAASREIITADFRELGRRLAAAQPDVLIEISPDHWANFFLNNLPSVCIGVGDEHDGPPEPFMKDFPWKTLPGDAALARHIVETALDDDFEPSISHRLTLDHGFCIPLWRWSSRACRASCRS